MSKSVAFSRDLLKLVFQNANLPGIGDAGGLRGSVSPGVFYISAHIGDPGELGSQATNEISYTGYARVPLDRNATNFVVDEGTGVMSLGVNVEFGEMTGGTGGTMTHWAVGIAASGATYVLYKGTTNSIPVVIGSIPRIKANLSTVTEE